MGLGTGSNYDSLRRGSALDTSTNFQGITNDDVSTSSCPTVSRTATARTTRRRRAARGNDRSNPRAWHGGDLRGVIKHLPYLKELGVTALWLTPWYDNWNGVNRCDKPWCPNTYYHGYHAIDYYAVEDRFGTMETLRELVDKAHALGIKVIQDQVANHVGTQHPWVKDPRSPTGFTARSRPRAQPFPRRPASRRTLPRRRARRSTAGSRTTCPT